MYLFFEAQSFPQALLSEKCSHLETDYVRGQISLHIFAPNGGNGIYHPSNILAMCQKKSTYSTLFAKWNAYCSVFSGRT